MSIYHCSSQFSGECAGIGFNKQCQYFWVYAKIPYKPLSSLCCVIIWLPKHNLIGEPYSLNHCSACKTPSRAMKIMSVYLDRICQFKRSQFFMSASHTSSQSVMQLFFGWFISPFLVLLQCYHVNFSTYLILLFISFIIFLLIYELKYFIVTHIGFLKFCLQFEMLSTYKRNI